MSELKAKKVSIGEPIDLKYGETRIAPELIWYGSFGEPRTFRYPIRGPVPPYRKRSAGIFGQSRVSLCMVMSERVEWVIFCKRIFDAHH